MHNKGLIKFFALLFGLVSIYQLSFTFKATSVEDQANTIAINKIAETVDDYKNKRNSTETKYLDSIARDTNAIYNLGFAKFNYEEVKQNAMNLGLDLKGGLNAVLQISVKDILLGISNNSKNPVFNQALIDAEKLQENSQNTYLEDFYTAFDAIKGDMTLSSPEVFGTRSLGESDNINPGVTPDSEVKTVISRKIDESVESAFEVLRNRIDQFGVTSPNIQRLGNSGRILIELPGVKDKENALKLIGTTAELQFWFVENSPQISNFYSNAIKYIQDEEDKLFKAANPKTVTAEVKKDSSTTESQLDKILGATSVDSTANANAAEKLFFGLPNGSLAIKAHNKDKVLGYLNNSGKVRSFLSNNTRRTFFAIGKPDKKTQLAELYALRGTTNGKPQLNGEAIETARQAYDNFSKPSVSMQMNPKGARTWEEMTGEAFKDRSRIAIVLDNIVESAPGVSKGAISGGNSEISGDFTLDEAENLAIVLRSGKLPAKADIIQSEVVGPSLGKEAIDSGMKSFLIALALVLIWMFFYYGKAGIFADLAMLLNLLLIFGALASFKAVLTLPGIAGIVLTIGMCVDANVLIFERIREELAKGKGQKESIKDGFANALSSILDANITTGLTALILFIFGTGPIKGFATTLLIGILTSLFTAIFITRLLVDWYVERGGKLSFSTPITKNLFRNININFLGKRKIAYVISGLLITLSLGSLFTNGLDQGVDFVGGRESQVRFPKAVDANEISKLLASDAVFGSADAKTYGNANQLKITTKYKVNEASAEVDEEIRNKLYTALKPYLNNQSYADFITDNENKTIGLVRSYKVSPTIADDIKKASVWAVLGSLIVVFLYILFRFKRWQFSLGAVIAVFHDVLIVLGVFSLTYKLMPFDMEIGQSFIAAILTVIGYSLNDTVVVFDRIREFFNEHSSWKFNRVINASLNSTLSRTLNTSLTTLVVLLAIFIFGGDSIRGFMFALIIGVIVGTYSSMFIATPIMYDTVKKDSDATEALKKKVKEEDDEKKK